MLSIEEKPLVKKYFPSALIIICSYEAFWQFLQVKAHRINWHSSDFWQPSDLPELVHNCNNCVWSNSLAVAAKSYGSLPRLLPQLIWSKRKRKRGKVYVLLRRGVALVPEFIHIYLLPVKRWDKIYLIYHVLA